MLPEALKDISLPRHIAIIMDGNGRWAEKNRMPRIRGHARGAETVREITRECAHIGIERLTLYAFSQENWRRPPAEVNFLMRLLRQYLMRERREIMDNNIRFCAIGRLHELSKAVQKELQHLSKISRANTGMTLCLALNYGGRTEIVDAAKRFAQKVLDGECHLEDLNESLFSQYLYDPTTPDPDLLIRTGGEMRISNFLLWEISYAELYLTPIHWPEFTKERLYEALREFSRRQRRFGGLLNAEPSATPEKAKSKEVKLSHS